MAVLRRQLQIVVIIIIIIIIKYSVDFTIFQTKEFLNLFARTQQNGQPSKTTLSQKALCSSTSARNVPPKAVFEEAQKRTCSNTRQFILYLILIIYTNINYFGGLKRHKFIK